VRGSCSAEQGGAAVSPGAADPMIHHLWTWTTPITALEVVLGRLLGSVSPGTLVGPYRCGRTYPITVSYADGVEGRPGSLLDGGCSG
jgi:hypothetical protein